MSPLRITTGEAPPAYWGALSASLAETLPAATWRRAQGALSLTRVTPRALVFACHDRLSRREREHLLAPALTAALGMLAGRPLKVQFDVGSPAPAAPVLGAEVLHPEYRFERLIVGPCNRLAAAAARAVAAAPGLPYNPLFFHGDIGLGKTHLLQALVFEARRQHPELNVRYLTCEHFVNAFIQATQNGTLEEFRSQLHALDLLALDDLHLLSHKEWSQEEFFHTFNALWHEGGQLALTSKMAPDALSGFPDRLLSRCKSGLVAGLDLPSFETRWSFVQQRLQSHSPFELAPDVAESIARRIPGSFRELEGAAVRVVALARQHRREIDATVLDEVLADLEPAPAHVPSFDEILRAVCETFGVRLADLLSRRRTRSLAWPRQVAMHLARSLTALSLKELGGAVGGRDHTTVMHGVQKVATALNADADFAALHQRLITQLRQGRYLVRTQEAGENV